MISLSNQFEELSDGEAEQMTLGAMLKSPDTMDEISTILNADDFYFPQHRILYEFAKELHDQNKFDFVTVRQWMKDAGKLDEAGGIEYIGQLKLSVPTLGLVKRYAERVREQAIKRRTLQLSYDLQRMAINENYDSTDDFISAVNARFSEIDVAKKGKLVSLRSVIGKHIREKINGQVKRSPMIGIPMIDSWMNGIGRDRLIVVAGRPGNGKTAFALKVARNVARQTFGPVPFFTLEMGHEELIDRMIADVTAVPFAQINRCELDGNQKSLVSQSEAALMDADLHFDDTPRMDMPYIASVCRRMKRERGSLGMVLIDYLGLIRRYTRKGETEASAIGKITGECKQLARELGCTVMLLCQMNREIEKRSTKRPVLSDLKDSGSIEQDADMVIFLHKDEEKSHPNISHIDLIVAKGRQTGMRDFELAFYGQVQRIEAMVRA